MDTGTLTLQAILQRGYAAYERCHAVPEHVRRAVSAILACRTALLGGHVQACPAGHVERIWYNSGRHRMCPQGAWVQVERWLAKQKARLLACEHYHVILTIPHELNELWLANVPVMTQLLFTSVHDTLVELLGDGKYLGAKPGIIATLHTWTQTLLLHPHIHCLVTGGGLSQAGQWVAVRHGFLLPMRVVMALFRGKLRAAIRQGLVDGTLRLPAGQRQQQVENLLNKLGRQKWHVHIRERYPYGHGVLVYSRAVPARRARSPMRACARVMASRWSSGMKSGPKALAAGRSSGRCASPWSSSLGAGGCMCRHPGPCWCAAGACMPTRRASRGPCAVSSSDRGRWRHPRRGIGRVLVRSGGRRIRNAVRSVGSDWCARRSSPGLASHPPHRRAGSRWHEGECGRGRLETVPQETGRARRGVQVAV